MYWAYVDPSMTRMKFGKQCLTESYYEHKKKIYGWLLFLWQCHWKKNGTQVYYTVGLALTDKGSTFSVDSHNTQWCSCQHLNSTTDGSTKWEIVIMAIKDFNVQSFLIQGEKKLSTISSLQVDVCLWCLYCSVMCDHAHAYLFDTEM